MEERIRELGEAMIFKIHRRVDFSDRYMVVKWVSLPQNKISVKPVYWELPPIFSIKYGNISLNNRFHPYDTPLIKPGGRMSRSVSSFPAPKVSLLEY